jgi:ABC-type multidrug transport system fused ATPase/permease subunit
MIGGLVTLLAYVQQFTSVFHDIAWQYNQIIQYNNDVEAARPIKNAFAEHHRPDSATVLRENWRSLDISNLNYSHNSSYAVQNLHSLHSISILLEKGKRIALIGESGSGKSTLLALLRGLYEPGKEVNVVVDGQHQTGLDQVTSAVTLFPQEPEIFENTIIYNITLGLPFNEAEVSRVCQISRFSEVLLQLPNGMESHIKEKGVNLSGGQKQRLALARGILAATNSEIVLMDEPTSSVDPKTELLIYQELIRAFQNKVMVSSLHRLHLLPLFDYIYVLDKGRIVGEGDFKYLRENNEHFIALWKHQEMDHGPIMK